MSHDRTLEDPSPAGELSAQVAKTLAAAVGWLRLPQVTALGPGAARELSRHAGTLDLPGIRSLSRDDARLLAWHRDWLLLDGLERLGPVAEALARHRGGLSLGGLSAITAAEAALLAKAPGDLRLAGLRDLPQGVAEALAGHRGTLWLDGVRSLSPEAARAIQVHAGPVSLRGLENLAADLGATLSAGPADAPPPQAPAVCGPAIGGGGPEPLGVAIIGGGFAGIAMGLGLLRAGRRDFTILEKAGSFGGTWRDNTYPGCACDVPSRLYSYAHADAEWSRSFATQPEILAYLETVAGRGHLAGFTRFGTAIERIEWQADPRHWLLVAADGRTFTARAIVAAVGGIHIPSFPAIDGLAGFSGPIVHTARWRHDIDLTGRHVAVIGTGASAIQVVPEIAARCGRLTVFQRSAPWILPRRDRPIAAWERWLDRRVPGLRRLRRAWLMLAAEARAIPLTRFPRLVVHPQRRAKAFLKRSVADPRLRRKLVPSYALGCKRVLTSDTYFAVVSRDNVEVVVEPIGQVGPRSITTIDGVERIADAIICATGYKPFDLTDSMTVTGRDGVSLRDTWRRGPRAFGGIAVPGFPNLFLMMGPNTALGHTSVILMIEAQADFILRCLARLEAGDLECVEVTEDAERAFNADLARRFDRSVWRDGPVTGTGGMAVAPCASWYRHASGRNHVMWPGTAAAYRRVLARARDWLQAR